MQVAEEALQKSLTETLQGFVVVNRSQLGRKLKQPIFLEIPQIWKCVLFEETSQA